MSTKKQVTIAVVSAAAAVLAAIITGLFNYLANTNQKAEPTPGSVVQNIRAGGSVVAGDKNIVGDGNIVTTIQQLTIQTTDSPQERLQKKEQARRLVISEILDNLSALDKRLAFAGPVLTTDTFSAQLRAVREKVVPAIQQAADAGYRKLIAEQQAAVLRQNFNSQPLQLNLGDALIHLLLQTGDDPASVRNFYRQLHAVQWATEALLDALAASPAAETQNRNYRNARIHLAVETLKNRSLLAHIAGLMALNSLHARHAADLKLSALTHLQPRNLMQDEALLALQSELLLEAKSLAGEKKRLTEESRQQREMTLEKYRQLDEQLQIAASDTWSEVVGKAIALRQLGRKTEAIAAFSKYSDMFADTDPTARQYARTAQQLTLQMEALGIDGGVYLYELADGGTAFRAGLRVGDVIIDYAGKTILNMNDLTEAIAAMPPGSKVRIVYLRMDETGKFTRVTGSLESGPMGAGFMPI